jgi:hypothetical protein
MGAAGPGGVRYFFAVPTASLYAASLSGTISEFCSVTTLLAFASLNCAADPLRLRSSA